jgi:hypothetical protein
MADLPSWLAPLEKSTDRDPQAARSRGIVKSIFEARTEVEPEVLGSGVKTHTFATLTEKDDHGKVVQEFDHRETFRPKAFEFLAFRDPGIPALDSPLAPDTPLQQLVRKDPAAARDIGPAWERINAYEKSKPHDARTMETEADIFRKVKDDRRIGEEKLSRKRKVREEDEYASRNKLR